MSASFLHHPSSFRDPSGFVFEKEGVLYRQVNKVFKDHFDFFIHSGCYEKLVKQQLLIPHEPINKNLTAGNEWYATLKPEQAGCISYPWEWSFDMLKDAALLTLRITKEAIASGLILKDATPYNVQWYKGKLTFIDTLSFEKYDAGEPWIAYRQFCESFLAPLLLMHYKKQSLQPLLLAWPEGIPLSIAKSLLPGRSKFSLHVYLHIHLHANIAGKKKLHTGAKAKFSGQKMLNLITSLEMLTGKLKLQGHSTAWSGYYEEASLRKNYLELKKEIIARWLDRMPGIKTASDLGANDGEFSCLLAQKSIQTIAVDFDPYCINNLYHKIKGSGEKNIQPFIADLTHPSPAIGFNNQERPSLLSRLKTDLSLALALIHHLVIGKNISLEMTAALFKQISKILIIEFVPKTDEKVQLMLANKKDIYTSYTQDNFEKAFAGCFSIEEKEAISDSGRVLYLMKRHEG